jgi:hypothetical protein
MASTDAPVDASTSDSDLPARHGTGTAQWQYYYWRARRLSTVQEASESDSSEPSNQSIIHTQPRRNELIHYLTPFPSLRCASLTIDELDLELAAQQIRARLARQCHDLLVGSLVRGHGVDDSRRSSLQLSLGTNSPTSARMTPQAGTPGPSQAMGTNEKAKIKALSTFFTGSVVTTPETWNSVCECVKGAVGEFELEMGGVIKGEVPVPIVLGGYHKRGYRSGFRVLCVCRAATDATLL